MLMLPLHCLNIANIVFLSVHCHRLSCTCLPPPPVPQAPPSSSTTSAPLLWSLTAPPTSRPRATCAWSCHPLTRASRPCKRRRRQSSKDRWTMDSSRTWRSRSSWMGSRGAGRQTQSATPSSWPSSHTGGLGIELRGKLWAAHSGTGGGVACFRHMHWHEAVAFKPLWPPAGCGNHLADGATRCQVPCTQYPVHLPYPTLPSPCRFMGIAEQMGRVLQRTSISVNIKERLDFSCALFDSEGEHTASWRLWPLPCSSACPPRTSTASNAVFTCAPAPQLQPTHLSPLRFASCQWAKCQWAALCPPPNCRQPGFQCAPPARPSGRHERGSQVPDSALCRRRRRRCRGAAGAMGLQEGLVR